MFRRSHPERPWPQEGFVTIVSAEAQEGVFLDVQLVEQLPERSVLRSVGEHWMPGDAVRADLEELLGLARSDDERAALARASELVEYAIGTGTGVAVVAPATTR